MKKEGIVVKLDGKYLEILMLEKAHCNALGNDSIEGVKRGHDCTTCLGCSSFTSTNLKTIRVLNKTGKKIKLGDRINYYVNFLALQFFIIVFLPFLAFGLTFLSLYLYSFSEQLCILFSFLTSFLVICLNFLIKKLLRKTFTPYI